MYGSKRTAQEIAIRNVSLRNRLLGAGGVVWFYLYKAVFPFDLAFVYPQWHIQVDNPLWWLPLLAAVIVTGVLWRYRKSWSRPFLFAWGFFCVALLPVMGLTDVYFMKYSLVADHYQHLALIAVIALAAAGWSVWRRTCGGNSPRGDEFSGRGRHCKYSRCKRGEKMVIIEMRLRCMKQRWLRIRPLALIHYNLGTALTDEDRWQEAKVHFEQALKFKPDYFEAHNNLGNILASENRWQEAIDQYRQALRLQPDFPLAHNNLGSSLIKTNRLAEAISEFEQAIRFKPDYINAYFNLALVSAATNQSPEALVAVEKALELARSQGQTATAAKIENWLNTYRAGLSGFSEAQPAVKRSAGFISAVC